VKGGFWAGFVRAGAREGCRVTVHRWRDKIVPFFFYFGFPRRENERGLRARWLMAWPVGVGTGLRVAPPHGGVDAGSGAPTGGGVQLPAAERRGRANAIFSGRSRGRKDVSPCQVAVCDSFGDKGVFVLDLVRRPVLARRERVPPASA